MRMRWGVADNGESASTETPVELGDSGDAIIGAGIVCLLRYLGVGLVVSRLEENRVGVSGRSRSTKLRSSGGAELGASVDEVLLLILNVSFVGLDDNDSSRASWVRCSHLPRTASILFVTRCEGVHLLAATDPTDEPVVFVRRLMLDCELARDNELVLLRDAVLSSKRVW